MRSIYLILLCMGSLLSAQQQPILRTISIQDAHVENYNFKEGDYVKDMHNQLNPYIGIWKYEGNGKTLILKIQKVEKFYNGVSETYSDELLVTYKYIKNGTVVVDNLNAPVITTYKNLDNATGKKYGTFGLNRNEMSLYGHITDIPLNIITNAEIFRVNPVNGVFNKIKIQYNGLISRRLNPKSFYAGKPSFELPNYVELTRQ